MTTEDVIRAVADIRESAGDPESAHGMEDNLYISILKAIAEGTAEDPRAMASEALKAGSLDFPRWCA